MIPKTKPSFPARALIALVLLYRATLSRLIGGQCRFHPTCSSYAITALETHGARRGSRLTITRLLRCHPWGPTGYDPVPEPPQGTENPDSAPFQERPEAPDRM